MTTVSFCPGASSVLTVTRARSGSLSDVGHRPGRAVDDVVDRRRHPQAADARPVPERGLEIVVRVVLADERRAQRGGRAGIVGLLGHGLVGDQRRLHDDARRSLRAASTS